MKAADPPPPVSQRLKTRLGLEVVEVLPGGAEEGIGTTPASDSAGLAISAKTWYVRPLALMNDASLLELAGLLRSQAVPGLSLEGRGPRAGAFFRAVRALDERSPPPRLRPGEPRAVLRYLGWRLDDLELLYLRSCVELRDEDVELLVEAFPALVRLDLRGCANVTDAGIARLAVLRRLRRLVLGETGVTDAGLAAVARLPKLEELDLSATAVTDAGLVHVGRLAGLRRLGLARCARLTGDGFERLAGLRALESLDLSNAPVGDASFRPLRALPRLRTLDLGGCSRITDAAVPDLAALPALELTNAIDTRISVANFHAVKALTFEELVMKGSPDARPS